jgi:hypothetical protein
MVHLKKIIKLAISALCIDEILEGVNNLFDSHNMLRLLLFCFVDDSIGSFADFTEVLIILEDVVFELFGLFHIKKSAFKILT